MTSYVLPWKIKKTSEKCLTLLGKNGSFYGQTVCCNTIILPVLKSKVKGKIAEVGRKS